MTEKKSEILINVELHSEYRDYDDFTVYDYVH